MREIKFRAWDKIEKRTVTSGAEFEMVLLSMDISQVPESKRTQIGIPTYAWERYDIMQYTGLHDFKGKEIYEGDRWELDGYIGIVTFEFAGWQFVRAEDSKCYQYPAFYSCAKMGKIIGNIYEETT